MTVTVKYNGYSFNGEGGKFQAFVTSRPFPEFIAATTDVEGADGQSFDGLTYGTREVELRLIALDRRGEKLHKLERELADVLAVRKPAKLVISDEKDKAGKHQLYRLAVPDGAPDMREFIRAGVATIRFRQYDPFLYRSGEPSVKKLRKDTWETVSFKGNAEVFPVVYCEDLAGDSYRLSECDGSYIDISAPFNRLPAASGSSRRDGKLTLDFKSQKALVEPELEDLDGITAGSRFFKCEGTMELKASRTSYIKWRERYL